MRFVLFLPREIVDRPFAAKGEKINLTDSTMLCTCVFRFLLDGQSLVPCMAFDYTASISTTKTRSKVYLLSPFFASFLLHSCRYKYLENNRRLCFFVFCFVLNPGAKVTCCLHAIPFDWLQTHKPKMNPIHLTIYR